MRQEARERKGTGATERLHCSRSPLSWTEASPYVAAVVAAAATFCLTLIFPSGLVLPALSVVLVGLAFVLTKTPAARGTVPAVQYLSATLAFIGFGAALLTDPGHVLPLLEGARHTP